MSKPTTHIINYKLYHIFKKNNFLKHCINTEVTTLSQSVSLGTMPSKFIYLLYAFFLT